MSLNRNQKYIFYKFVRSHIAQKRPIGSKFLAKKIKKFSPSTLRFYFRKLVDDGYLKNTDNFVGREPTEKGWHYYLDNYHLVPEIKIDFKDSVEEFLEKVSLMTKNVVFFKDKNSSKFVLKGLKTILIQFNKNAGPLDDLGNIIENLEKIVNKIDKDYEVLIGREIKESQTGNLSLFIKRTKNFEIGFLGHKINFYHTLCLICKNFKNE